MFFYLYSFVVDVVNAILKCRWNEAVSEKNYSYVSFVKPYQVKDYRIAVTQK